MSHIEGAILSSFRAGIVAIRSDGTVAYINPIGAKILEGCPLREGENIHPRAAENVFFRVLSEALSMNYLPTRVEAELPGRDGERQSLGFTLSELKEKDGRVGICAFFKDLTHVEMAEESENLKQRLLMLGQMAAGLAHEIRNPIASIGVHASILRSHLSGNEKLLSSVNMMSREIEKVELHHPGMPELRAAGGAGDQAGPGGYASRWGHRANDHPSSRNEIFDPETRGTAA